MRTLIISFCLMLNTFVALSQSTKVKMMTDTDGNAINAHGGGILYYGGTYYWYGELKSGPTYKVPDSDWENYRVKAGGVSCYSSKDLKNWKFEGVVLPSNKVDKKHDLHTSKVIERPKVIYNKKTKKFVMWMHIDSEDYSYARSGVAISDSPVGPFIYKGSVRPNGNMARDMTLFVDDDGKAYHFYSSEENATMHISLLTDDYLSHTKTDIRILIGDKREAPAVFKYNSKYYLVSSGCTGWSPNEASYATADSILGNWTTQTNPCVGKDADKTFYAQSTFVLPVIGKPGKFFFIADMWNKLDLKSSKYLWLPLHLNANGVPIISNTK
ncbi:glycoside hydrolase family 43 protein [Pedobacter arcticus]|uniref:glycoside hydrolase family 43 protein n=1 Tax=Pedobacter arcticus TaxID=752140 RepID=UPI0003174560|nr:glycoside hydrolase family 43 protein [Pedobacter arcticus]